MNTIKGFYTVVTTPFFEDESINLKGIESNIEWLIEKKVHGLLIVGALSEYNSLTIEERKSTAEFILKQVDNRIPIIVGTTSSRPQYTIDLTNHAKKHGAAAVMVLPTPGSGMLQEEVYEYYKYISASTTCPIMIYNNPYSSGIDITFETLKQISKLPNITAIKESSGDIRRITQIMNELSDTLTPICGWEDLTYEAISIGVPGYIAMAGNFMPDIINEMHSAFLESDYNKAFKLYKKYIDIAQYLENAGKVTQTCKYIMDKIGLVGGYSRLPKQPLNSEEKSKIDAICEKLF